MNIVEALLEAAKTRPESPCIFRPLQAVRSCRLQVTINGCLMQESGPITRDRVVRNYSPSILDLLAINWEVSAKPIDAVPLEKRTVSPDDCMDQLKGSIMILMSRLADGQDINEIIPVTQGIKTLAESSVIMAKIEPKEDKSNDHQ